MRGLFFGDAGQLGAQCIGVVTNVVWVAATAALAMKVVNGLFINRAAREDEVVGLDIPEMGMPGYADEQGDNTGARPPTSSTRK